MVSERVTGRLWTQSILGCQFDGFALQFQKTGGAKMIQTALKYDLEVLDEGRVELRVPFPMGTHVTVFVTKAGDAFDDLRLGHLSGLNKRQGRPLWPPLLQRRQKMASTRVSLL
jgi:hypothetical protein